MTEPMAQSGAEAAPRKRAPSRRQHLAGLDTDARADELNRHLRQRLGVWLLADDAALDAFEPERLLDPLGKDWAFLSHTLLKDLGLRLYPNELRGHKSIASFARYLAHEIPDCVPADVAGDPSVEATWPWAAPDLAPPRKTTRTAFVLSTPRAGSTLLRVMLEGHSKLFAPPELWLLPFGTLRQRQAQLRASDHEFLGIGLTQAVAALWQIDDVAAEQQVATWLDDGLHVSDLYRLLADRRNCDWLIDKTPGYAASVTWMQQAESLCDDARYLLLIRHPYTVIESFVRMRFHRMFGTSLGIWHDDPFVFGAMVWDTWNRHAFSFLDGIPEQRKCVVRYEDIVGNPEGTMTGIASFFGVDYEASMINPYDANRMTFRGSKHVATTGDPNFANRDRLDARLADWAHIRLPAHIRDRVRDLAGRLGYEVPQ